ncbi:MAG: homocysteine S-methyltransferase [Oscillochloridaceae bacterium umkhey_bin13]
MSNQNPIATRLRHHDPLILDGALATELERRGCDLHDPLWSAKVLIEQPQLIQAVHHDYFAAGADVAITASYQASFAGFAQRGLDHRAAAALMARSVELAATAREHWWHTTGQRSGRAYPLVAASIGPYGAYLHDGSEYRGDYALDETGLLAFHRPRMAALLAAGPDLLACETIPCLTEARVLARLLGEFPGAWAWISFSARNEHQLSSGEPISAAAELLANHPQVVAIGINCTPPHYLVDLLQTTRAITSKPLLAYPNSGEHWDATSGTWHGTANCDDFATAAQRWHAAGAQLIGGCCRTTPEHIRMLRAAFAS